MRGLFIPSILMFFCLAIYSSVQAHENAVVAIRLFSSNQGEYGTGFVTYLNGNKVVVTNIHVVQGEDNPSVIYSISGRKSGMIETEIKKLYPKYDLAVLEPREKLPKDIHPLPIKAMTPSELKTRKNLRVVGYFRGGDGYNQQDSSVEVTNDQLTMPRYLGSNGQPISINIKVITLGGLSYNGMSGSPILLDGHVVGVMWASVNEGGSFCWALPIRYLKEESINWRTWSGLNFPVLDFRKSLRSGARRKESSVPTLRISTSSSNHIKKGDSFIFQVERLSNGKVHLLLRNQVDIKTTGKWYPIDDGSPNFGLKGKGNTPLQITDKTTGESTECSVFFEE